MEDRRHDGGWGKERGASKFFGVVVGYNHCRTVPPSLLAGTLPVPLFTPRVLSLSLFLLFSSAWIPPPFFVFRLAALSLSVPMGLRGQHGGISDQFFKPRVPRLYTSWETTLGWVPSQSETSAAAPLSGVWYFGLVSRSEWGWNQAAKKIKTRNRRILKGSRPGCSRISISATNILAIRPRTFSPISSPRNNQIRVFS